MLHGYGVSLLLAAFCLVCGLPAPSTAAQPARRPAAPVIKVIFPDTMKVSVREPVPVRARFDDAVTVKLDEPRPWLDSEVLAALIGVALGLLGGEGSRWWRERRRIGRLKAELQEECRSLVSQVHQFIDLCEQMIEHLQRHRVLPGPAVRGIRTIYDATIAELAPHLTLLERNLLHVVHERIRVGDELIASHLADVREEVRGGHVDDPWATGITMLNDQIKSYREVQRFLTSFLDGAPVDVFYLQRTDVEPPIFERRQASAAIVPPTFDVARHFLRIVGAARQGCHGIEAKIGAGMPGVGARTLRPDLQRLHGAIEEFKASEARVVELRQPALEAKLSKAFQNVERVYARADSVVAPYERPDVAADAWSSNQQEFRALAASMKSKVAVLDSVKKDLEKLTR